MAVPVPSVQDGIWFRHRRSIGHKTGRGTLHVGFDSLAASVMSTAALVVILPGVGTKPRS
jgi:hypothetical protein